LSSYSIIDIFDLSVLWYLNNGYVNMKKSLKSEKLILNEIADASQEVKKATRGLSIGKIIVMIRKQLGMSQSNLARLAGVPQSTISRIESSEPELNLSTLRKVLNALSCEVIVTPLLSEPIETIRRKQALRIAEKHVRYLQGTMGLEKQEPDKKLVNELIKSEVEELLHSSGNKLWQE
jgi:transcriptional regulator with XRE-family HTH domain